MEAVQQSSYLLREAYFDIFGRTKPSVSLRYSPKFDPMVFYAYNARWRAFLK
jgi:hypothetical protein